MSSSDLRRGQHLRLLRMELIAMRRATRAQLSERTGLSTMTVGKLLAELEARGEVRQDEQETGTGGRPSTVAAYREDFAHFAAISVRQEAEGNAFTFCVYNLFGEEIMRKEAVINDVREDSFDDWLTRAALRGCRLKLVVFALPGEAQGDHIFVCDFPALLGERFLPRIRARFGVETIFENDVNTAVFGHGFGEREEGVYAGLYFPMKFGPGAGVVMDGKILHGCRHFAGEIAALEGQKMWQSLDYGDEAGLLEPIGRLVLIYCCVIAPQSLILYGSFFTPDLMRKLSTRVQEQLSGQYAGQITSCPSMARDIRQGARRLCMRRMQEWLRGQDGCF
mgnify:CR=1 FL=1